MRDFEPKNDLWNTILRIKERKLNKSTQNTNSWLLIGLLLHLFIRRSIDFDSFFGLISACNYCAQMDFWKKEDKKQKNWSNENKSSKQKRLLILWVIQKTININFYWSFLSFVEKSDGLYSKNCKQKPHLKAVIWLN